MQRLIPGLLLLPALALLGGLAGCGKEEKTKPTPPKVVLDGGGGGSGAQGGPKKTIKAGKATIVGAVVLDGAAPAVGSLEDQMSKHNDKKVCLGAPAGEKQDQTWAVGKNNGVANAVVWLSAGDDAEFEVVEDKSEAILDQPHCVYIPHVLAIKPGQKLNVKNSAEVAHNTKLDVDELVNKKFAQTIPPKGSATHDLKPQDKVITATCDFHGWMKAKIWVLPHQYVAVTKDDGSFKIDNVPEGVELSVVAWHEGASPNFFHGGKKGTTAKFNAGENKLELKVKAP